MKIKIALSLIIGMSISVTSFAADQVAKVDMTPPPSEGVAPVSQIPMLNSQSPSAMPTQAPPVGGNPTNNGNMPIAPAEPDPAIQKAGDIATGVLAPGIVMPSTQQNSQPPTNQNPHGFIPMPKMPSDSTKMTPPGMSTPPITPSQ